MFRCLFKAQTTHQQPNYDSDVPSATATLLDWGAQVEEVKS